MPRMAIRILVGLALVAALGLIAWLDLNLLDKPIASRVLLWVLAMLAFHEVTAIAGRRVECYPGLGLFGAVAIGAVALPAVLWQAEVRPELVLLAGLVGAGIRFLGMAPLRSSAAAFPEAILLFAGVLYTAGALAFLDRIIVVKGVAMAFSVVAVSKASDICGYLVGTLIGSHPIAPAVSPKKTWEGTVAAVLGSGAVAVLLREYLHQDHWHALGFGVLLGAASFLGDLLESGFKRWGDTKDSSSLLPEFGGFLDMLDGVLVAAPVAVVCLFGS